MNRGKRYDVSIKRPPCGVPGCDDQLVPGHRKMCHRHYRRWLRHGNPLVMKRAPNGAGTISSDGYRIITVKDGRRLKEHRYVMEKVLGRRLKSEELVHHIDGNKLNNHPKNLTLMNRPEHKKEHASFRSYTHKECTACHRIKPRSEFHKQTERGCDPHTSQCGECRRPEMRRQYAKRVAEQRKRNLL